MPAPANNSGLRDNHTRGTVADGLELANELQQKRVAQERTDWIERKVDIKTIKLSNLRHGEMYHVATASVEDARK